MPFRQYTKIHALGKEETDGILDGTCWIQEKVDGANASIWIEDGEIKCGSRNNLLEGGFNGFHEWATNDPEVRRFLEAHPDLRIYGEWLVRHTIHYNEDSYKKFYAFDLERDEEYLPLEETLQLLQDYDINQVHTFGCFENPTGEMLNEFIGKSVLGPQGEGVVIKNPSFKNKFLQKSYAKIVTPKFKETNSIVFGGNNKTSPYYWEQYVVNKYIDAARVRKIMHKIESETGKRPEFSWVPRLTGTVYHDVLTEEIWEIAKKVAKLDFGVLKRIASKKAAMVFKDILQGTESVAYNIQENVQETEMPTGAPQREEPSSDLPDPRQTDLQDLL